MRKSVKHKRNQESFEKAKQEIQGLKKRQQAGKIDLYYFDECGLMNVDFL